VSETRRARGTAARLSGRRGEVLAALWLMAKGEYEEARVVRWRRPARAGTSLPVAV